MGSAAPAPASGTSNTMTIVFAVIGFIVMIELAIIAATGGKTSESMPNIYVGAGAGSAVAPEMGEEMAPSSDFDPEIPDMIQKGALKGENVCANKNPRLENVECIIDALTNVGPQSGANVTKGYVGGMEVDSVPITTPYWMNGMCPVNVHWHLGAEHLSMGEFDETGDGPNGGTFGPDGIDGGAQPGYRCQKYDAADEKFTKPYEWKHCIAMEVGETYEVHWPHSAAGACGTPNQYQTPFYDGVFCTDGVLTDTARQVGVQAQVFTIVNDEAYYYPDLMRGMIVDGEYGQDIHKYTGSTTGSARSNLVCSQYSPITWQVDRKCHLISASSFDKLCADMKGQRDDMTNDLWPHGSRELVDDALAANNGQRRVKALRA